MGSDWVKHDGGECPESVSMAAKVGLKFRNGKIRESLRDAAFYTWPHTEHPGDIVAYRIEETAGEQKLNPTASSVPIPDGWRALEPEDMVERFDVIWNAEKRKGTPVSMWGYPLKNDNGTGLVIIRQLPNGYHRGCGSVDVGVDR